MKALRTAAGILLCLTAVCAGDSALAQATADLMLAAQAGLEDIAADLIKAGAKIDARNTNGYSALMLAAAEGHTASVKILLVAGADRSLRNKKREQAREIARSSGHAEVAAHLE